MIETCEKSTLEEVINNDTIDSDTFVPTGKKLGFGCWGSVDVYNDQGGQKWAIKIFSPNEIARKQMKKRGWTEEDVMRREAIPLDAAAYNVVPRLIERDKKGKMYVAMPVYDCDLSSIIDNLSLNESLAISRDIANGFGYIHSQKDFEGNGPRAHGDGKPSNVFIKNKRAYLSDLGSSTCISTGGSGSERGSHGDINYRAPECSKEDAKPSTRADNWSLGAILYKAIAKEGIYEGIDCNDENLQKFISTKLRRVPRKIRPFLKKCLSVPEYNRFYNGSEALNKLEKVIENLDTKKTIKDYAKKLTVPIGLPLALVGFLIYGAATHEPQRLEMPETSIQGMLYPPSNFVEEKMEFEQEEIDNLPKVSGESGPEFFGLTHNAKMATDNRIVAYLLKTYSQTQFSRGFLKPSEEITDYQFRTYMAYTLPDDRQADRFAVSPLWPVWEKSIEVALNQAKIADGKIDLEDLMIISRIGPDLVNRAKRNSGSFDYKIYRTAKDPKGKYIIPEREQNFINNWLAYYKANID